jgi:hypothetical protein
MDLGAAEVLGIDGVQVPREQLLIPPDRFKQQDFTAIWDLGRQFEAAFCLEVVEHLNEANGSALVDALVKHSDAILFSAASPRQPGQDHLNCQWPCYWQKLFNERGYACDDSPRWRIWDDPQIEVWYRQNIFVARRRPEAGKEPRIRSIIHPGMPVIISEREAWASFVEHVLQIENGQMPVSWYFLTPFRALIRKAKRSLV